MSISYGHGMIQHKKILLEKQVNSDLIDMSFKKRILVLHLLLVFTG
jgi:hypothetical protein